MRRALLIGSSHLAALKLAAAGFAARRPDWSLDFFAVTQAQLQHLTLREDGAFGVEPDLAAKDPEAAAALAAALTTLNRAASIDTGAYDHVCLVGLRLAQHPIKVLLVSHDVDDAPDRGRPQLLSAAAYEDICAAMAAKAAPDAAWGALGPGRAFFMPRPHLSAAALRSPAPGFAFAKRLAERPEGLRALFARYMDACAEAGARRGLTLIRHPEGAVDDALMTHERFSVGSRRWGAGAAAHPDDDFAHMNADYGALCLDQFARIADAVPAAPRRGGPDGPGANRTGKDQTHVGS